jgi:hypothetical protein
MKISHSIAEILILTFVALNCYVNVRRYYWEKRKRKIAVWAAGSDYDN